MMVVYDHASTPAVHPSAAITMRAVERGTASVADVHFEQDSDAPRSFAPRTSSTGCISTSKRSATSSLP